MDRGKARLWVGQKFDGAGYSLQTRLNFVFRPTVVQTLLDLREPAHELIASLLRVCADIVAFESAHVGQLYAVNKIANHD